MLNISINGEPRQTHAGLVDQRLCRFRNSGIERLKSVLDIDDDLPGEERQSFHTLGGFIMHMPGRIPAPTDHFETVGWRFDVMDMDGNRVDKVLVSVVAPPAQAGPTGES